MTRQKGEEQGGRPEKIEEQGGRLEKIEEQGGFCLGTEGFEDWRKGTKGGSWLGTEGSEDWRKEKSRVVLPWYS